MTIIRGYFFTVIVLLITKYLCKFIEFIMKYEIQEVKAQKERWVKTPKKYVEKINKAEIFFYTIYKISDILFIGINIISACLLNFNFFYIMAIILVASRIFEFLSYEILYIDSILNIIAFALKVIYFMMALVLLIFGVYIGNM